MGGSADHIYLMPDSKARQPNLHTLEIMELYVQLTEAQRAGQCEEFDFDTEPYCWETVGSVRLMPDAKIRIVTKNGTFHWWVELDLSSEWRPQITAKMRRFCQAYFKWEEDVFPRVIFLVPEEERKRFIESIVKRQEVRPLFKVGMFNHAIELLTS